MIHSETEANKILDQFPPGTRIVVDRMGEDPNPIPPGTKGVVLNVDDIGTVHCVFENGRLLGLIPGEDQFHAAEQKSMDPHDLLKDIDQNRDVFWVYPQERLIQEIYFNPDNSAGGQFVSNFITYKQILKAEEHSHGNPESFFAYLDSVCLQLMVDIDSDPQEVMGVIDAFNSKEDLAGLTKETMDALMGLAHVEYAVIKEHKRTDRMER